MANKIGDLLANLQKPSDSAFIRAAARGANAGNSPPTTGYLSARLLPCPDRDTGYFRHSIMSLMQLALYLPEPRRHGHSLFRLAGWQAVPDPSMI